MMPDTNAHKPAPIRVAIVVPSLAAYRVPVFNRLSEIPNLELELVFAEPTEHDRKWDTSLGELKFKHTVLPTVSLPFYTARGDQTAFHLSPGLWGHLSRGKFDLVVTLGWTMPNTFIVWLMGKLGAHASAVWDESIPHSTGGLKKIVMPVLKRYFGSFDGYLAASHACIEYMVQMSAPRERVVLMPQITDNAFFSTESARYRAQREEFKRELGIHTRQVILFVGQLTPRKNVLTLLDAFRDLAATRADVSLLVVGEGGLRTDLLARRDAYHLQDRVFIESFVVQAILPKYYALADVFVLPSVYDTFGVVVAEAMACGLPIVTTPTVGASSSIVVENGNGLLVTASDTAGFTRAFEKILADDGLRVRMGAESERLIAAWDVERVAQNFGKLIFQCLSGRRPTRATRRDVVSES